jgi:hypothetical protein
MTRIYLLAAKASLTWRCRREVTLRLLSLALGHANRDGSERSNIIRAMNHARRI